MRKHATIWTLLIGSILLPVAGCDSDSAKHAKREQDRQAIHVSNMERQREQDKVIIAKLSKEVADAEQRNRDLQKRLENLQAEVAELRAKSNR